MAKLVHITTVPETLSFFSGQVRFMKRQGFAVEAISSPGKLLEAFAAAEGSAVHAMPMARRITPFSDLLAVLRLWLHLRRTRPEIVHAHTPKAGLLGMLAAWLAGVPVRIYHIHGLPFVTATGLRRQLLWGSERVASALAHQVLCVSPSVRAVASAAGVCTSDKIKVPGHGSVNGVDAVEQFNPAHLPARAAQQFRARHAIPDNAPVLGFVGRVVRDKGLTELAAAWQVLRMELPDLHLLIVGPFEPFDPLPSAVEALLRSDPRIHLTGECTEMPLVYAVLDVLVLPTYREGFGVVAIEAAAMERPVVATDIPGCVDAVADGVTGTLVPVHDAVALAAALRRYFADPALRRQHGRAGRQRVLRDFAPEALWQALAQTYAGLLRDSGVAVPPRAAAAQAALNL